MPETSLNNCLRMVALSLLAFIILVLSGCGSHVALTKETRSRLQLVEVSKEIKGPDNMAIDKGYYSLGLAGFLVSLIDRPDKEKADKMNAMLREEIPRMFRQQFITTLKQSNLFQKVRDDAEEGSKPDALFILTIEKYGFGMDNKPSVCATGKLILHPSEKEITSLPNTEDTQPAWQKKRACEFNRKHGDTSQVFHLMRILEPWVMAPYERNTADV